MSRVHLPIRPLRLGVFGAAAGGLRALEAIQRDPRLIAACVFDNDPGKWGSEIGGLRVEQPTAEACDGLDGVVIASVHDQAIRVQLARLGCPRTASIATDLFPASETVDYARTAVPAPDAIARLTDALIAQTPHHVAEWAETLDREPDAVPPRGAAWSDETACTICCNNYLAYAVVLARSFLRHHPGGRFFIGLADRRASVVAYPDDPRIRVIEARELDIPEFDAFAFKYDVLEFNTAIKPSLLEHLFRTEGVRRLLYLDPDILVLAPLSPLFDELSRTPLVLTPHVTRPFADGRYPREIDILRTGMFNLGFIGLAAHEQTEQLLAWWRERLYDGCRRDVEQGYFTDQKWIDFVPSFFPEHRVVREPGYNAAYWNLHERAISVEQRRFLANGEPLRFFHFSGIDVERLEHVSRHQNRHVLSASGALRDLFELYRFLLLRHNHLRLRTLPYTYGQFENGVPIPDIVRTIYRDDGWSGVYPRPFATNASVTNGASYFDWLREPSRPGVHVTNLLAGLHAHTSVVKTMYPDLYGAHLVGFLLYTSSGGAALNGLPAELNGGGISGSERKFANAPDAF